MAKIDYFNVMYLTVSRLFNLSEGAITGNSGPETSKNKKIASFFTFP
jgi:hypothetical protein